MSDLHHWADVADAVADGIRNAGQILRRAAQSHAEPPEGPSPSDPPSEPSKPAESPHVWHRLVSGPVYFPSGRPELDLASVFHNEFGHRLSQTWAPTRPRTRSDGLAQTSVRREGNLTYVRTEMKVEHAAPGGVTSTLDQHLPFPELSSKTRVIRYRIRFRRPLGEKFRSLKLGGLVAFDGDWKHWPGGNNDPGVNSSVRLVLNDDYEGGPFPALYVYTAGAEQAITVPPLTRRRIERAPHILQVVSSKPLHETDWMTADIVIDKGHVSLDISPGFIETEDAETFESYMKIAIPQWGPEPPKWNRGYAAFMYGGSDSSFAPRPDGKGTVDWSVQIASR